MYLKSGAKEKGNNVLIRLLSSIIIVFLTVIGIASSNDRSVLVYASDDSIGKPQVQVPVDMGVVEREQKSVDEGHSPWKLDPVFVAQVFVSLKISPGGIQGEYPIRYEDLREIKNTGRESIVEVMSEKSPIKRVYLKRLIRNDNTGIWTVVGYDPVGK